MERALDILDVLRDAPGPMSVLEIAKVTGLDRTVVHRQLRTLAQRGMTVEEGGSFRLGPASVLLASRYVDNLQVRRLALPHLLELDERVIRDRPWTATLSIPVGAVTVVVERIWTRSVPLGLVLDVGDTHPIDRGAAGRCLLAYQPEHPPAPAELMERIRAAGGVALSQGEASPGVYAVAAAIRSRQGHPVAAIAVSGADLGEELAYDSGLALELRRAAHAIGQGLT
ncbi:IclR family transcriptional regulator [Flindersiella endophytica]